MISDLDFSVYRRGPAEIEQSIGYGVGILVWRGRLAHLVLLFPTVLNVKIELLG
jgi:hypothetical protein